MRALYVLQKFHQQAHKSWIDESIGDIWIKNNWLKVQKYIKFIIDSARCGHGIVHLM